MSLAHSSSVVTNGLIFTFDVGNTKSYKGPAVQNLANAISVNGTGTTTGYSSTGSTEIVDIPEVGTTTVYVNTIQNNYTSYSPNSGNCCPSLHAWGGFAVSPSTQYTYLILYKCDSGYTNSNYMYRYEYTSNGGSYVTEGGVHNDANRVHLGGGWYYAWGTFTTQATTNWLGYCAAFYYRYSNLPDRLSIAKVAIMPGNWSGLHPKYWPNSASTRSNTNCLIDIVSGNTITASSLTTASDGSFSFNGSSNGIVFPENSAFNTQSPTVEVWVKTNATTQNGFWFEKGNVNTQYALFQESNLITWRQTTNVSSLTAVTASYMNTSQYAQVVGTYTAGDRRLYVNGVQVASDNLSYTIPTNTNGCSIGVYGGYNGSRGYYYNGKIDVVRIYNRALSPNEVRQNFNALRGRYGL